MSTIDTSASDARPHAFPHTRWSMVLAAVRQTSPESKAALEQICCDYWYPLYAFVRRSGHAPADAQDLTQEFFRLLLEKRWLASADRDKGRLRTFLITALKRFMAKQWRHDSAQRRGGGLAQVPIDSAFAEGRYAADPAPQLDAEAAFDRQWAITLLDLTLARLEQECTRAGKPSEFALLKHTLTAERGALDYEQLADRLGVNAGAARVAVHRFRRRFREIYRRAIASTLPDGTDLDAELDHLARALARS